MPKGNCVRLALVPIHMKPLLRHLLTQYLVEFAAMEGREVTRDTHGHVPYRYFDQYWSEPERFPFGIWVDNELRGFCLLRDSGEQWSIAEFFVKPAHRRKGIGAATVSAIKEFCRLDGRHQAIEGGWSASAPSRKTKWVHRANRQPGFDGGQEDQRRHHLRQNMPEHDLHRSRNDRG